MSDQVKPKAIDLAALSVKYLKGVGPAMAKKLEKLNLYTAQDILFHLPFRYQDRTRITPLRDAQENEYAVIEGVIAQARQIFGKQRMLRCVVQDGTGQINLVFFHFNSQQQEQLAPGARIRCFGEIRFGKLGIQIVHPEYQIINDSISVIMEEALTPIYPTTEGVSQTLLRKLSQQVIALCQTAAEIKEYLPNTILELMQFPTLLEALQWCHRPPPECQATLLEQGAYAAQKRLAFEELLAHQLTLQGLRQEHKKYSAPLFGESQQLQDQFLAQLSFQLTNAQLRVAKEISQDLASQKPMLRLVQGDVGSGKTVVAGLAMLRAVENNYQAVLMAPTEILAEQHFINFSRWLNPLNIAVGYLSGKHTAKQKEIEKERIKQGDARVIVGTHALFQNDVEYANLGLVVIDEQHRFGVHQRLALRAKGDSEGEQIHQLIMTATPIPRTLAMTAYAHLDCSIIDELPPGRIPVTTVTIPNSRRDEVIERLHTTFAQNRQAYWVCTLIEESEALTCEAAEKTFELLKELLPEVSIGLVHGRLKSKEKEAIMQRFKAGEIQLLVATTVIEVGVDVPNASVMIIENPERLGLAQLHQLRGRVGRGHNASHCVLLYNLPLSQHAQQRLAVMRETNDGFIIAKKDLELRGPGEFLGTRQTGLMQFKIADLIRDEELLESVQTCAVMMLRDYPGETKLVIRRWVSNKEQYTSV
jgi:ATP-dependent DNA helicase RecG